jgi:hypothetical protein
MMKSSVEKRPPRELLGLKYCARGDHYAMPDQFYYRHDGTLVDSWCKRHRAEYDRARERSYKKKQEGEGVAAR